MTSKSSQHFTKLLAILGGLVVLISFSYCYGVFADSRSAARFAAEDLAICQGLIEQINQLKSEPVLADNQTPQHGDLTGKIEQASRQVGITPANLVRIWPDPARRIPDTPYMKKATQILFREVTLKQVISFIYQIAAPAAGPQVTYLQLAAPREGGNGKSWTVEMTLTYTIYSPEKVER